jgi:hypothetical protein
MPRKRSWHQNRCMYPSQNASEIVKEIVDEDKELTLEAA